MTKKTFFLPFKEWRKLRRRAYNAARIENIEVCGAIITDDSSKIRLVFLKNYANPGSFSIIEEDLDRLRKALRGTKDCLIGIFHSHPCADPVPGPGDLAGAQLNHLQLIYDVCGKEARLWRIKTIQKKRIAKKVQLQIEKTTTGQS